MIKPSSIFSMWFIWNDLNQLWLLIQAKDVICVKYWKYFSNVCIAKLLSQLWWVRILVGHLMHFTKNWSRTRNILHSNNSGGVNKRNFCYVVFDIAPLFGALVISSHSTKYNDPQFSCAAALLIIFHEINPLWLIEMRF